MRHREPLVYMVVGGILLGVGAGLPFLMVVRVLESTFLLNFVAYGSSVVGLVFGLLGAFSYVRRRH